MKEFLDLQDDIKLTMGLGRPEATGWYSCKCPVCNNDRKTGGFMFEEDKIVFQCFRASCDSNTGLTEGEYVSKKFRNLMDTIGVQIPVQILTAKRKNKPLLEVEDERYKKHYYKQITPDFDYTPLHESSKGIAQVWIDYFDSRYVDSSSFLLISGGKYRNLVAIPMYFFDRLIGHTIVTQNGDYLKEYQGNTNILVLPECSIPDEPIIVEGLIDAYSIPDGVGLTGDHLSPEQAYFIRNKKGIMVPDKTGNRFIDQFERYEMRLSLPNWDVKDVNAAVTKYGVIETMNRIKNGCIDNRNEAMVKYKLWLED